MDYILRAYCCLYRNVAVWEPRHNLDHYMVLEGLRSAPLREHTKYLGWRKWIPLRPLTTPTREDRLFAALRRSMSKPKSREARNNVWILADMWRLVNDRVSERRGPARDQALIRCLGHAIKTSLKGYRRRRTEEAGKDIDWLLGADLPPSTSKPGTR